MIEFGAHTPEAAAERARALMRFYEGKADAPSAWLITDPAQQTPIWTLRETGASATNLSLDPDTPDPAVGWEDAAVDPLRLGDYLREFSTGRPPWLSDFALRSLWRWLHPRAPHVRFEEPSGHRKVARFSARSG
jgi:hypothetical protein